MASLLTFEEAQERVLAATRPLPSELVPTAEAGGRVIVEDARARVDLPPFANSAMDGFAVRAADLPATLPIVGESAAGSPLGGSLQPDSAAAISTGAVCDLAAPIASSP